MITISVCMIVKNEADILARCLDSLKGIWDELIIVDTGSTDATKQIAAGYTDHVYDFSWTGDFSEARNFALSHATCEYIYTADADEILEGENRESLLALKEVLDTKVDVVQMYYDNQLDQGTVYNFNKELRPKLFKRLRPIVFMDPLHETLDIEPVVIDVDIAITHKPTSQHASRDIAAFKRILSEGRPISDRLHHMLTRELYKLGTLDDYEFFSEYLVNYMEAEDSTEDGMAEACVLLIRYLRMTGRFLDMFGYVAKGLAMGSNSELCTELGQFYLAQGLSGTDGGLSAHQQGSLQFDEHALLDAAVWFYNAYQECEPIIDIRAGRETPLTGLVNTYEALGQKDMAAEYREELAHCNEED